MKIFINDRERFLNRLLEGEEKEWWIKIRF